MHAHAPGRPDGCHAHGANTPGRRLAAALLLSLLTAGVEAAGAVASGSLALLADAGHVAFDSLAIALAWGALRVGRRPASGRYTWGFGRVEVLAAAVNGLALLAVAGGLAVEGVARIRAPAPVAAHTMMAVAAAGLVCNGLSLWLLEGGRGSVGVRAAFLHVAGDVLVAAAVLVGGAVMHFTQAADLDGWLSLGIAGVLGIGALRLLWSIAQVLLEVAPPHLDVAALRRVLGEVDGVVEVGEVRLWSLTPARHVASAHVCRRGAEVDAVALAAAAAAAARTQLSLDSVTVQVHGPR